GGCRYGLCIRISRHIPWGIPRTFLPPAWEGPDNRTAAGGSGFPGAARPLRGSCRPATPPLELCFDPRAGCAQWPDAPHAAPPRSLPPCAANGSLAAGRSLPCAWRPGPKRIPSDGPRCKSPRGWVRFPPEAGYRLLPWLPSSSRLGFRFLREIGLEPGRESLFDEALHSFDHPGKAGSGFDFE